MDRIGWVIEQSHRHLLVRKRAKRGRTNELSRMFGHDHLHAHASFLQTSHDLARLVCRNAARHTQKHRLLHGIGPLGCGCSGVSGHDDPLSRMALEYQRELLNARGCDQDTAHRQNLPPTVCALPPV